MSIAERYRPHYTYEDYCQWEGRWELIEGMPYAMSPAPVPAHQRTSFLLGMRLENALNDCKECKLYPPLDWKIKENTIVQPDLLIVCNTIEKKYLDFPPALVVEILSPATAAKDRGEKMELYQSQKVKYYLIVDPQFKKVEIYEYIHAQYEPVALNPQSYQFELHDGCNAAVILADIWE
ncbi:Uma2 family endonuclease [Ferruginibacter paludis]|uniref:Uma2 family endonuclease n=1 Tax=Ferruginibacter paludis TaxID=1310417 RepID=UPI0025B40D53|nr:Uma2 family endonuclease [Ferruginibacter paludis]MDN3658321.1 Uma2 family endonuclease [Ferruginibacter paludis]